MSFLLPEPIKKKVVSILFPQEIVCLPPYVLCLIDNHYYAAITWALTANSRMIGYIACPYDSRLFSLCKQRIANTVLPQNNPIALDFLFTETAPNKQKYMFFGVLGNKPCYLPKLVPGAISLSCDHIMIALKMHLYEMLH